MKHINNDNRVTTVHTINLIPIIIITMTFSSIINASPRIIWKDNINYVDISSQSEAINTHPVDIKPEVLSWTLRQLRVIHNSSNSLFSIESKTSDYTDYVFTDKEVDILTRTLCDAFTSADINEVATFTVSDFKSVYFGNKYLSVSGRAFISGKYLNIIFGEINVDLQKKYIRSGSTLSNSRFASNAELANFKLDTGSISRPGEHDWQLQPFVGTELVNQRHDWIRISLEHDYNQVQEITQQNNSPDQTYLANDLKHKSKQNNLASEGKNNTSQKIQIHQKVSKAASEHSFEARLRKLKELYDMGYISESVYQNKLHQIISEL